MWIRLLALLRRGRKRLKGPHVCKRPACSNHRLAIADSSNCGGIKKRHVSWVTHRLRLCGDSFFTMLSVLIDCCRLWWMQFGLLLASPKILLPKILPISRKSWCVLFAFPQRVVWHKVAHCLFCGVLELNVHGLLVCHA